MLTGIAQSDLSAIENGRKGSTRRMAIEDRGSSRLTPKLSSAAMTLPSEGPAREEEVLFMQSISHSRPISCLQHWRRGLGTK
jgi:hypothetical protein